MYGYVSYKKGILKLEKGKYETFVQFLIQNYEENSVHKSQETKNALRNFYVPHKVFHLGKLQPNKQFQSKPKYRNKAH